MTKEVQQSTRKNSGMSPLKKLPDGWCMCRLGDLTERSEYGTSLKCDYEGDGLPVLRIPNIVNAEVDFTDLKRTIAELKLEAGDELQPGDMLICRTNGSISLVGKTAVIRSPLDCPHSFASYLLRFRFLEQDVLPKWVHFFFGSQGRAFVERHAASSAGQHNISLSTLHSMPLPIAPQEEQRRIVAKIEELFSDLDAGVAALERVRANLKRYRATVLKAAVTGKLTEDWRAQHPDTEPASVLLERILTERRHQWEQAQLAKFAQAGKQPPKGWQEKYGEPTCLGIDDLPELPIGWTWVSVSQLAEIQGGLQKQPSRKPLKNKYPFLRVANVLRGRLDLSEVHDIELFAGESERLRLQAGDLLVVEGNGSRTEIGRSALWGGEIPDCVHQNHIIRVRLYDGLPKYLNAYWNSPDGTARISDVAASTSGLYTLSVGKVGALPVPLPPKAEQEQIVAELECRLSIVDEIEAQVEANLKRAGRLRQGILKRAFDGRLVPQVPTDEPAEKLLERIRQQRQPATKMYNGRLGTRRARRPRRTSDPVLPFPQDDGSGQGGKP